MAGTIFWHPCKKITHSNPVVWCFMLNTHVCYPLVDVYITMKRSTIFNGKIHYKWWFSIAMLNYQRVSHSFFLQAIFGSPSDPVTVLRRCSAGVGYPQLSAVLECADAAHGTLATFRQDQTLGKLFLMSHWDHLVNIQTNYGTSPIFPWVNQWFLWPFSIAM